MDLAAARLELQSIIIIRFISFQVVIEDVDPELFKYFLEFLYTGAPPDMLSTVARGLLPIADRFGSMALMNMCEDSIVGTLSSANAIKALLVAHTHRCSSLKEKCLPIIRENLKSLMGTEDWKQLEKNHDLTVMVLESFAG